MEEAAEVDKLLNETHLLGEPSYPTKSIWNTLCLEILF